MKHRFELDGEITRDQIPDVRKFVERMHRKLLGNGELVSRIAMAAHELFENAVKFSTDGSAKLSVDISRDSSPLRICITTENRASDEDLEELREMRKAIYEADDMMLYYINLMKKSDPRVRGGLGLGRVAAEAEMKLHVELENDLVVIRAELVEQAA
jgi:hypothetical protein